MISAEVFAQIERMGDLPSLPRTLLSIQNVASDDRSSAEDLAVCILEDQALTMRVLKVVNSAMYQRSAGEKVTCTVTLEGEERYRGQATGMDNRKTRLTVVGNAVLDALRDVTGDGDPLMLDGVEVVNAFGRRVVLALVHTMKNRRAVPLTGAALVEDSPEETAVLAVLDATNRWVANT